MELIPMKSARYAALAVLGTVALAAQPAGMKLDDVIKKSVDAIGGLERIKAIKSAKFSGKIILGGGQMEAPLVAYKKRPLSNRMEISIQGQQIVEAYDGTTKWSINPMLGSNDPQKANEEDTKVAADDFDLVETPLVNYKEKGHTAELLGKEDVEGSMAYKIKLTLKNGNIQTVYLDEKSFLTVKLWTTIKGMGQEFEAESLPGNYKAVEGVMIAFSNAMRVNKQVGMQMLFDKVEVNVPLEDSIFTMPEVKKVNPPKPQ